PGGLVLDSAGNLFVADSMNNEVRLLSTGLGFPATEIATPTPVIHTIFLQINRTATLTAPTTAPAENNKQEFQVGTVSGSGCTMDGATTVTFGTICNVPITFNPAYPGERTGTLKLIANTTPAVSVSFGL